MDIIDRYLRTFRSENTKKTYRCSINKFFKVIKADPKTYLDEERDYEEDVIKRLDAIITDKPKGMVFTTLFKEFIKKKNVHYKIFSTIEAAQEWLMSTKI